MKIKLLVVIISVFSVLSFGQTKKVEYEVGLKKDFTAFFENIKEKNIENAIGFMYPKYVSAVSREQVFRVLTLSYNNPAFMTDIQDFKIIRTETPEQIDGEYFSITDFSFTMKFKADWKVIHDPETAKQKIGESLIEMYGKDHVVYFSKEDYYLINTRMKACGVSRDLKSWKFLLIEKARTAELKTILPKNIMDKL